jgi:FKBP-type peptidyl-prolyl cis-trans isomerase
MGLSLGQQLQENGVTSRVPFDRIEQGIKEGVAGKKLLAADQMRLQAFLRSAAEAAAARNTAAAHDFLGRNVKSAGVESTPSGLQYKIIKAGNTAAPSPRPDDSVTLSFRGTLLDGTEFDNSYKRGQPASFPVSRVIPGWTEGLQLMKPGAKYELFVPPQLAYDMNPPPGAPIPPGSMLVFEVELISVRPARCIGGQPTMPHIPPPTQQSAPSAPASK